MPKLHIPHWKKEGYSLCGRTSVLFIFRSQSVDEATCHNCWRADDALQVRNYQRECKESGIDPDTLEKIK